MSRGEPCGHPAEPGRKRCRDCRRRPGRLRASRTSQRGGAGPREPVYKCLTEAEYTAIYEAQGGRCAICETPVMNRYQLGTEGQAAYADHTHRLEKDLKEEGRDATYALRASIRGLLCLWCNRHILVALHDSARKAQRAADYLTKPPAQAIVVP